MTYLNQFHEEEVDRKIRKINVLRRFPMNSEDAARYLKRNLEIAKSL